MRSEERRANAGQSLVLFVSYDGAPFSGFARQEGLRTVQGRLESALSTALRRDVGITCAGRTDTGVHALGQVVSFEADGGEPGIGSLRRSLDALVGPDIVVTDVSIAKPGFSARFDAVSREYRYRIVTTPSAPLFLGRFAWHVRRSLDSGVMEAAARHLLGEHDFRSFCASESAGDGSTVRRVHDITVKAEEHLGETCLTVRIVGNAFLHSMVRVIVGSLVEVGCGRRDAAWMGEIRKARDRAAAGPTAPAHGLVLHRVAYPEDVWE